MGKDKIDLEFFRNISKLISGTTIAQVIPFFLLPIITRLYEPNDFTTLEQYLMFVEVLVVLATLKLEFAIMHPKKKEDAIQLVYLIIGVSFIVSILFTLLGFVFNNQISVLLNNPDLKFILPWIGLGTFLLSLLLVFNYWFSRNKRYGLLATTKIVGTSTEEATKLGIGMYSYTSLGVVIGFLTGRFFIAFYYVLNFIRSGVLKVEKINVSKMKTLIHTYNKYPRFTVWSSLLGRSTAWIHILLFSLYFSPIVGFVALARRILFGPLSIISSSYSQVFYQRISEINDPKKLMQIFKSSLKPLVLISGAALIIVLALPDGFIDKLLGDEWVGIQSVIEVLIFWFAVNFISSSVSFINLHLEKQKEILLFDFIHFILVTGAIYSGIYFELGAFNTLKLFAAVQSLYYLAMIVLGWYFIRQRINQVYSSKM